LHKKTHAYTVLFAEVLNAYVHTKYIKSTNLVSQRGKLDVACFPSGKTGDEELLWELGACTKTPGQIYHFIMMSKVARLFSENNNKFEC
jgi:hypothetical protein